MSSCSLSGNEEAWKTHVRVENRVLFLARREAQFHPPESPQYPGFKPGSLTGSRFRFPSQPKGSLPMSPRSTLSSPRTSLSPLNSSFGSRASSPRSLNMSSVSVTNMGTSFMGSPRVNLSPTRKQLVNLEGQLELRGNKPVWR